MEPRIETAEIKLAVVQGVLPKDQNFVQELQALYDRLFARVGDIRVISATKRTFGHWHFIDNTSNLFIVGIEVDSLDHFKWDYAYGLGAWSLGNTTWAIWPEKDGEEGTIVHGNVCWEWLAQSDYDYDARFMGDFEVHTWSEFGGDLASDTHEIWIPIVRKED